MLGFINRKKKGAAAFEWVILSPLMIVTFVALLYFFLITTSYVQYNNLANKIAQDMNMRQSGYNDVQSMNRPVFSFKNVGGDISGGRDQNSRLRAFLSGTKDSPTITNVPISTNSSEKFLKAAYYSIEKNKSGFYAPGVLATSIRVDAHRNGVPATNFGSINMSGTIINVRITFKAFGLTLNAKGYNIIT